MNADEVKKILIELVNASFDCGAFPDEDMLKSDDYQKLTDKSRQLTDTIANLIESQQKEIIVLRQDKILLTDAVAAQQKELTSCVMYLKAEFGDDNWRIEKANALLKNAAMQETRTT